jgi:hypothetical protein
MATEPHRIDVNDEVQLQYWIAQLGCSEQELLDAIRAVGVRAAEVRSHFQRQRLRSALAAARGAARSPHRASQRPSERSPEVSSGGG